MNVSGAASAIASALLAVAAGGSGNRRLYLRCHMGVATSAVFDQLQPHLTTPVTIRSGTEVELAAAPVGGNLLIPYLVDDRIPGMNRGLRGYAGTLRTDFASNSDSDAHRVLLVLDETPFDTVLTAAENAGSLPQLSWPSLVQGLASSASGPGSDVVAAVAADLTDIPEASRCGTLLDEFAVFAAESWASPEQAGMALTRLEVYVADRTPTLARLKQSRQWRSDLQLWTRPDRDLSSELTRRAGRHTEGVGKVLASRGINGLDWQGFTLDDLPTRADKSRADVVLPAQLLGTRSVLTAGRSAAAWLAQEDESLAVRFSGDPAGLDPSVRWGGQPAVSCKADAAALLIHVTVPRTEGLWHFGRLQLRRGQYLDLAVFRGSGSWFPVESHLELDTLTQSFIAADPPSVLAVGPDGVILGTAVPVGDLDDNDPADQILAVVSYAGTQHEIPLTLESSPEVAPAPRDSEAADDQEEQADEPSGNPDREADASYGEDRVAAFGGTGAGDGRPGTQGTAATASHALLAFSRARARSGVPVEPGAVRFNTDGQPGFSGRGLNHALESQALTRHLDGLEVERALLLQPEALAFTASFDGTTRVTPDRVLEHYTFGSLSDELVSAFFAARSAFFVCLRESGSVHALLCGTARVEARAYVDAYQALLLSVSADSLYAPEYDRLLLCDLVSDPSQGECWLAPTNPVTVAWVLQLSEQTETWVDQAAQLSDRDLEALTPAFMLPLVFAADTWWEADPQSPRLWRRYRPMGSSLAQTGGPETITRRLDKFLSVFPRYADPRQRLAIGLHEPGDGGNVASALRKFYLAESRPGAVPRRPSLDVTLYTVDGRVPEKLAELVAPDSAADVDKLVRSRIRLDCRPSSEEPGFAHLSFVFQTPTQRKPRPAGLTDRCPTAWVGGLACAPGRTARIRENEMAFASGLFAKEGDGPLGLLLARTLEYVGGQPDGRMVPGQTQVATSAIGPNVLEPLYEASVWTTHADRLLGPEAFSSSVKRAPSIVDFDDRSCGWQAGLDSITVTSRIEPYRTALTRAFAPVAALETDALPGLISLGNAVSGRWNLDLLHLPVNNVRERLGVLAAIASVRDLDQLCSNSQGGNDLGGVVLPLSDLIALMVSGGVTRPAARMCDDLMYLRVIRREGAVELRARLIEVKFATEGQPDLGIARRELDTTRVWLQEAFQSASASRVFRSRDLAEFLRTGAARNSGFGLPSLAPTVVEEVAAAIAAGDYTLRFGFTAGGEQLSGDVVSLELDSLEAAHRQRLPGQGSAMGYVRLGRPVLQQLANGQGLKRPQDWPAVTFPDGDGDAETMPDTGRGPVGGDPVAPGTSEGGGTAAGEQNSGSPEQQEGAVSRPANVPSVQRKDEKRALAEEVAAKAAELDEAAAKYALNLAPFQTGLAQVGPSVIRFRTRLLGKQTIGAVRAKALDMGREIGVAEGVLVDQEPYFLTVDVPRQQRVVVPLADHMGDLAGSGEPGALPFLLGMAPSGEVRVADLARLPHLLVAGATGSGKSVLLRGLLTCLAQVRSPQQLQILIIDPKQIDFMPFEALPHLVGGRIVTDPAEAVDVLGSTLESEVAWRRSKLRDAGATSALEFYEMGHALEDLPQMVILVDEFADLGASLDRRDRQSFMNLIQRFGQLTRAFGIYLVLATQRPSVQVITGDIKANLTARVALKMQSAVDSTTILGRSGAESLRDRGDLLFDHAGSTERLQAFYTTLNDVRDAVARWSNQ